MNAILIDIGCKMLVLICLGKIIYHARCAQRYIRKSDFNNKQRQVLKIVPWLLISGGIMHLYN